MPDALVLAGGGPAPTLTGGSLPKAFATVGPRTMVEYVLAALRAAPGIARVALVGPPALPPAVASLVDVPVAARGGLLDNLAAGLAALGGDDPVLVAAADTPLLTPEAVAAFLAAAPPDADVAYAIVPLDDVLRACPGARKSFVRLADGTFTGGSLVLLRPRAFVRVRPMLENVVRARKRPWELARLFGLGTLIGLAAGRLRIVALEERAAALTGLRARAVVCHEPSLALDVDGADALAAVRALMDQSRTRPASAGRAGRGAG